MKLPILVAFFLTSSSLGVLASEEKVYGAYGMNETQSVSPQADQPYKAPDHKAGTPHPSEAPRTTQPVPEKDHKAGGSHKAGTYHGRVPHQGYFRHGRFYHWH